jgi:O-antigen ligase/polysaccharide polymerase Wzy-like membrane protein
MAGAIGAALVLLGRSRLLILPGLALLALGELGLVHDLSGNRVSAKLAVLGVASLIPMAIGAAILVRWPALVTPLIAIAAPFRPPLSFGSEHHYFVGVASSGQLGRLLPLYGVLSAAALALAWQLLRGLRTRRVTLVVSVPAIAFLAVAAISLLWTDDLPAGENVLAYFLLPFGLLVGIVARSPFPPWLPRVLAMIAVALGTLFAVVGLIQAATHKLWFFSPAVEVGNAYSSFFRVTSLFRDPSLYGRHVVIGIVVLLVAVLYGKVNPLLAVGLIGLMFAGLWFSYSQSSMAALFVVTLVLAALAGGRSLKLVAAITAVVVLLGAAAIVFNSARDHSARRFTSDRSRRVELTWKVFKANPVAGVGLGAQPVASQARSKQGGSPTRFVSHTTPLTVAAELGVIGLAAYFALLGGSAVVIEQVRRRAPPLGLGLGAVFLALFVHSTAYSGFFEDPVTWLAIAVAAAYVLSRADSEAILGA